MPVTTQRATRITSGALVIGLVLQLIVLSLVSGRASASDEAATDAMGDVAGYETTGVLIENVDYKGSPATAVEYASRGMRDWTSMARTIFGMESDNPNPIALLTGTGFSNGTIEVDVASTIAASMLGLARGFAGVAFRVSDDRGSYELVYLRPANGRVEDEIRRSHALQYAAHPDFHFDVSRSVAPGQYEAGADIGLDEWIHLRIDVNGAHASVFVNGDLALEVDDMKLGADRRGGVALWVGQGSRAYFRDLTITPATRRPTQATPISPERSTSTEGERR